MSEQHRELRLDAAWTSANGQARAALIVDRLAASRPVTGEGPEWRVTYRNVDVGTAVRLCDEDLTRIDPSWREVMDFEAVPSRVLREPEFD